MTTVEIMNEFNTLINKEQDYTLTELKTILSDVYKTVNGAKKVVKKIIKKVETEKVETEKVDLSGDEDDTLKKKGRPVKSSKDNGEKKKREPSAYNIFIKDKYAELKLSNPGMTAKEIMLSAAAAWTTNKQQLTAVAASN